MVCKTRADSQSPWLCRDYFLYKRMLVRHVTLVTSIKKKYKKNKAIGSCLTLLHLAMWRERHPLEYSKPCGCLIFHFFWFGCSLKHRPIWWCWKTLGMHFDKQAGNYNTTANTMRWSCICLFLVLGSFSYAVFTLSVYVSTSFSQSSFPFNLNHWF